MIRVYVFHQPFYLYLCTHRRWTRTEKRSQLFQKHPTLSNFSIHLFLQVNSFLQRCLVSLPPALTVSQKSPHPPMRSPRKQPEQLLNSQYYFSLTCHFLSFFKTDVHHLSCFYRALLLSDDEEDTKRVVRSAKDKRLVLTSRAILKNRVGFSLYLWWCAHSIK